MIWALFLWCAGKLTRHSSLTLMEKFIIYCVHSQNCRGHVVSLIYYVTWLLPNVLRSKKELFYQSYILNIISHYLGLNFTEKRLPLPKSIFSHKYIYDMLDTIIFLRFPNNKSIYLPYFRYKTYILLCFTYH